MEVRVLLRVPLRALRLGLAAKGQGWRARDWGSVLGARAGGSGTAARAWGLEIQAGGPRLGPVDREVADAGRLGRTPRRRRPEASNRASETRGAGTAGSIANIRAISAESDNECYVNLVALELSGGPGNIRLDDSVRTGRPPGSVRIGRPHHESVGRTTRSLDHHEGRRREELSHGSISHGGVMRLHRDTPPSAPAPDRPGERACTDRGLERLSALAGRPPSAAATHRGNAPDLRRQVRAPCVPPKNQRGRVGFSRTRRGPEARTREHGFWLSA
jgi:hypothetical protein